MTLEQCDSNIFQSSSYLSKKELDNEQTFLMKFYKTYKNKIDEYCLAVILQFLDNFYNFLYASKKLKFSYHDLKSCLQYFQCLVLFKLYTILLKFLKEEIEVI